MIREALDEGTLRSHRVRRAMHAILPSIGGYRHQGRSDVAQAWRKRFATQVAHPGGRLHAFRHYAARKWVKARILDLAIRQLMRHADLTTTQIYT